MKIKSKILDFFTYNIWIKIPHCWIYTEYVANPSLKKQSSTVWYFWAFKRKFEVWRFVK